MRSLQELLESELEGERIAGCEQLWRSRKITQSSQVQLLRLLATDPSAAVRWRAVEALRCVDDKSQQLQEAFHAALHDPNFYVRYHARLAVWQVNSTEPIWNSLEDLSLQALPAVQLDLLSYVLCLNSIPNRLSDRLAGMLATVERSDFRTMIIRCLAKGPATTNIMATLRMTLSDPDETVRIAAAVSMCELGDQSSQTKDALIAGIQDPTLGPRAWCLLKNVYGLDSASLNTAAKSQDAQWAEVLQAEAAALGVLPSIGLKSWNKGRQILIPARKEPHEERYPWQDLGVYQSWQAHAYVHNTGSPITPLQACIHADWFPGIHLIPLSQVVLHPPNCWDPETAPVLVEGNEAGPLIQSGGTVYALTGMRRFPTIRTDRIDFIHGIPKDLRTFQLLMYSGMCANTLQWDLSATDLIAARVWNRLAAELECIFRRNRLSGLVDQPWFSRRGIRSIRYGVRYERPYCHVRPGLIRLSTALTSGLLHEPVSRVIQCAVTEIEDAVAARR